MDINPKDFDVLGYSRFDWANHTLSSQASLSAVSCAWIAPGAPNEQEEDENANSATNESGSAPDLSTINYWLERMRPLVDNKTPEPVYVVFANRCGIEEGVEFAGSSTVFGFHTGYGEVVVYDWCGRDEEKCMVVELSSVR